MVLNLDKENFGRATESGIVMVDFWADWCNPCKTLSPIIDEVGRDFDSNEDIIICKANVDQNEDAMGEYGIRNVPTILFFKDGQVVDKVVGMTSKNELVEKINSLN